ncbi:hypothetical protein JOC54_002533 [Alkalihalobacillus xiaoxiensis]|uniref:YnhF family membrane protein n=1 Tax=Shouchella xiaoxiensis TaxID=766895 RepID=A0ABS2SYE7_9BACI|nr:hypothetical protein [Shouchella xiaoxiensis]
MSRNFQVAIWVALGLFLAFALIGLITFFSNI